MHDPAVEAEKLAQFEKDAVAFNALSPRQQRVAEVIAKVAFWGRRVFTTVGKVVLGVPELIFKALFMFPYVLIARSVKALANGIVHSVKLGVKTVSVVAQRVLPARSEKIAALEKKVVTAIDSAWHNLKEGLRRGLKKTGAFLEYYGALGLYRGTMWVLNPRTPSGKPLFGNEAVNKAVGIALAAVAFGFLSFELTKIAVMAKIWHIKFAHSMLTDTAPMYIKLAKQALFHPLLTVGLTSVKFVTLPMIAASRQMLKSMKFTQGVSFQYNVRLRQEENEPEHELGKTYSFSFIKKFVQHVVEKASPEFYKARLKHYRVPQAETGASSGLSDQPPLAKAFNDNQSPRKKTTSSKNMGYKLPKRKFT